MGGYRMNPPFAGPPSRPRPEYRPEANRGRSATDGELARKVATLEASVRQMQEQLRSIQEMLKRQQHDQAPR